MKLNKKQVIVLFGIVFSLSLIVSSILFVSAVSDSVDTQIIEKNKNKLNVETRSFLKEVKDKEQQKEFIVKFRENINNSKLNKVSIIKTIDKLKVTKVKVMI